jgi:hypothetical protein
MEILETRRQSQITLPLFYHFLSIGLEPNDKAHLPLWSAAEQRSGATTG